MTSVNTPLTSSSLPHSGVQSPQRRAIWFMAEGFSARQGHNTSHIPVHGVLMNGLGPGLLGMLNSKLVIKGFLTWHLIGRQLCCQPIRCQVWKWLFNKHGFLTWKFLTNPGSCSIDRRARWHSWQGHNSSHILPHDVLMPYVDRRLRCSSGEPEALHTQDKTPTVPNLVNRNIFFFIQITKAHIRG